MVAFASLFIILLTSLLITRVAAVALMLTGISRESARFQARSAFTGVGFTTSEAEQVVNHPVRRRIIMLLMLVGNAGIVTVMASLILTFANVDDTKQGVYKILLLALGLFLFWLFSNSKFVERRMQHLIGWALTKWTRLDARDYAGLLQLAGGYGVTELKVDAEDWVAGKNLAEMKLSKEGLLVLSLKRQGGEFVGAPTGDTVVQPGDTMMMYGRVQLIKQLDIRERGSSGDAAHERAKDEQERILQEQEEESVASE